MSYSVVPFPDRQVGTSNRAELMPETVRGAILTLDTQKALGGNLDQALGRAAYAIHAMGAKHLHFLRGYARSSGIDDRQVEAAIAKAEQLRQDIATAGPSPEDAIAYRESKKLPGARSRRNPVSNGVAQGANGLHEAPEPSAPTEVRTIFTFVGDVAPAPPRELIKGLSPAFGVAITGGQSSAGKTFIEIHRAVCLATGLPYFGHKIVERVGTAVIAAEGRALIPTRFDVALLKASIKDKLPIAWPKLLPDFSSAEGIKLFIRQLKALNKFFQDTFGVRLGNVPIDTVAASFGMKDEDDNSEATRVCNVCRTIGEEVEALVRPVHHYGKDATSGLRGASAWRGSADIVEGVLADIDPLTGRASNRELVCAKARDGEQGPVAPFELEFVQLGRAPDGDPYGSMVVVPGKPGQSRFGADVTAKGKRALLDAITEALDNNGEVLIPRAGMPPVKAAKVTDVREEFDRRYVVDEKDPVKAAEAKRKAFKRNLDKLDTDKFGAGAAKGTDWIWRKQ